MFIEIYLSSYKKGLNNKMQIINSDENSILSESFLHWKGENTFITNSSFENDEMSVLSLFIPTWTPQISMDSTNEEISPKEIKKKDITATKESKDSNDYNGTILKKKRKRGRQNHKELVQHSEFKNDNKMAKIQVSYFSFLIAFLNAIMKLLNINYYFIELNGKQKSNINQKYRDCLNKKTIKEIILETPISGRFKKDQYYNAIQYNQLVKDGQSIILDIMEKNFLFFFDIYFNNVKKFNLGSFGLKSFEVELPKNVKFFNDLLNKRKSDDFERYKKEMEKCAKNNFISVANNTLNESTDEN